VLIYFLRYGLVYCEDPQEAQYLELVLRVKNLQARYFDHIELMPWVFHEDDAFIRAQRVVWMAWAVLSIVTSRQDKQT
jgi:hypothetical protein